MYKHAPNVEKTDAAQSFYLLEERYSLRRNVSEQATCSYIREKQTSTVLQCERGNNPCGGVGQDKTAPKCVRTATMQSALRIHVTRARHMNTLFLRS